MIVTFISQCEKKAHARTRKVLDAFANRIGDNTWQTVITEDGLAMVKRLLLQTASKNTAVSCYRFHTRKHSELVWIVGNRNKFNEWGWVPVNRTRRNVLHSEWQNDWQYINAIVIMATLAGLWHDVGKSTQGFQRKLTRGSTQGDPYRHEWLSLHCWLWFVGDCQTDDAWLDRLVQMDTWLTADKVAKLAQHLSTTNLDKGALDKLPPLAGWLAWLIVSHHRLPPLTDMYLNDKQRRFFQTQANPRLDFEQPLAKVYARFSAKEYWVKNPTAFEYAEAKFWRLDECVLASPLWQKHAKRWANKARQDIQLTQLSASNSHIDNASLLYLSRLCLMVGDHNYSCLQPDDKRRVATKSILSLLANTDRKTRVPKQYLDEHLVGVAGFVAHFARHLPIIAEQLPTLTKHHPLAQNTSIPRFAWQNHAYKSAKQIQKMSDTHGFFGINMASTGCGKTIANARIMYGLSDEQRGARFSIALGLRVLTLQTGASLRTDLALDDSQLAVLVGGQAVRQLFDINQADDEPDDASGSESTDTLIDGWVDGTIDYHALDGLHVDTLLADSKARQLLFAPLITCTIDHLMQASECRRGGSYIAPMLRLLSSDLILDEPDDFDHQDLPALSRLVHLVGLFGGKLLLSSATLPPDLLAGLFESYQAGRVLFNQSQNKPAPKVVCAWFDEQHNSTTSAQCEHLDDFISCHHGFVSKRTKYLAAQAVRHQAEILSVLITYHQDRQVAFYDALGQIVVDGALTLHARHHNVYHKTGQAVSIGLVRIANIKQLVRLAVALNHVQVPDDTHIHVACYHARQLLVLRNHLEHSLDTLLKRDRDDTQAIFAHDAIKSALRQHPARQHIFMVLATPVAEVGRDHDYDWAVVEPSSMRSIIQLAGRVWRHRPDKQADTPNILILQHNIRYLQRHKSEPVFVKPGFETDKYKLTNHDIKVLIGDNTLKQLDARPRICRDALTDKPQSLADLEHVVMADLFHQPKTNHINAYWRDVGQSNRVHTHLQQISPFRHGGEPEDSWVFIPRRDVDGETGDGVSFDVYATDDICANGLSGANKHNKYIRPLKFDYSHPHISTWLSANAYDELVALQTHFDDKSLVWLAIRFSTVSLSRRQDVWYFNAFLGLVDERLSG